MYLSTDAAWMAAYKNKYKYRRITMKSIAYFFHFLACAVFVGAMFRPVKHPIKEEQGDE